MKIKSSVQSFLKPFSPGSIIGKFRTVEVEELEKQVDSLTCKLETQILHYDQLLRLSSDGIMVVSADAKVLYFSEKMRVMLGYSEEEMYSLYIYDWDMFYKKRDVFKMMDSFSYSPVMFESQHKRKDGSKYSAAVSAVKIKLENQEVIYFSIRDISQQKQKEKEKKKQDDQLRQVHLRMQLMQKIAQVGVWEFEVEEKRYSWDENMYKLHGYEKAHKEYAYRKSYESLDDREKSRLEELIAQALQNNGAFESTFWITTPLEEQVCIGSVGTAVINGEGRVEKLVGVDMEMQQQTNMKRVM